MRHSATLGHGSIAIPFFRPFTSPQAHMIALVACKCGSATAAPPHSTNKMAHQASAPRPAGFAGSGSGVTAAADAPCVSGAGAGPDAAFCCTGNVPLAPPAATPALLPSTCAASMSTDRGCACPAGGRDSGRTGGRPGAGGTKLPAAVVEACGTDAAPPAGAAPVKALLSCSDISDDLNRARCACPR